MCHPQDPDIYIRQKIMKYFLLFILVRLPDVAGVTEDKFSSNEIIEKLSAINLSKVGLGMIEALDNMQNEISESSIKYNIKFSSRHRNFLHMSKHITQRLQQIEQGNIGVQSSLQELADIVEWQKLLNDIEMHMESINKMFKHFTAYQMHDMEVENVTLLDFASHVVSHESLSIHSMMASIHSLTISSKLTGTSSNSNSGESTSEIWSNSVFKKLEDAIQRHSICSQKQSPQQLIYGLYIMIAVTQARGYEMIYLSYNILGYFNKGTFAIERQFDKDLYMQYSKDLFNLAMHGLSRASNSFRRCDPVKHEEGKTYVQITELLQGYIENEVDMNGRGSCTNTCEDYDHTIREGCFMPDSLYCGEHRRCQGIIHDCIFIESDANVCLGSKPYRRYDWIHYKNLWLDYIKNEAISFGDNEGECKNSLNVNSWWRWFYHCSYCMCLCDDPSSPYTDRFISLRPAVSDIDNNKIMTGIRFVKKNRVIQIEVMEGLAIGQGQVNAETQNWREVEPISVESNKFQDGVDYFTLKYESRDLDLDRLKAPKKHVLTGVRFGMLGQNVNLEIRVTPINFTTGLLHHEMSYWISNDVTITRTEVVLVDPDDPSKNLQESEELSEPNMFVKFQPSSLEKDVSQLTVPFFDAQPVVPSPPTWLEGVEIYYRGLKGFGGFIGLQVFNYNISMHFNVN